MRSMKRWKAIVLAAAIFLAAVPATAEVYADAEVETGEATAEEVDAEGAPPEGEGLEGEGLEGEGAEEAAPADTGSAVTPGTVLANNGLYIANTFPDSMMPEGFHRQTVAYEGQNIDLAYMDNGNGLVVLAYLTDATGMSGDFYLCDTATATMTDYVRFDGGNGKYLIVLDPGDNVNPPAGFTRANLNVNNKNVAAWTIPNGSSSGDEETSEQAFFRVTETVYATGLDIGAGAGNGEEGDPAAAGDAAVPADASAEGTADPGAVDPFAADSGAVEADPNAAAAAEVAAASVQTDISGFVKAQPSEFFLVYGIDQSGLQGFYLYDTLGQTYQRYLEIDTGESEETAKYRKSAQIRLFIIAGLVVFAVVLLFIIINMALSGRSKGGRSYDYDDDEDDEVEAMKKRVKSKEKKALKKNGRRFISSDDDDYDEYGDDGYDEYDNYENYDNYEPEEEDDVRYYDRGDARTGRGVRSGRQAYMPAEEEPPRRNAYRGDREPAPRGRRRAPEEEDDYWDDMGQSSRQRDSRMSQDIDLDDDFNFDFIKPNK